METKTLHTKRQGFGGLFISSGTEFLYFSSCTGIYRSIVLLFINARMFIAMSIGKLQLIMENNINQMITLTGPYLFNDIFHQQIGKWLLYALNSFTNSYLDI